MTYRAWERAMAPGLVLSLLIASSLLVANLDLLPRALSLPAPAIGREKFGELLVEAWLAEEVNNVHIIKPLPRLAVSLTRNNLPVNLLPLHTNNNGVLRLRLPAADYLVSIEDPRFQFAVKLAVSGDHVTQLTLHVKKVADIPSFYELFDSDSSGWVDPWEKVVMALPLRFFNASQGQTIFIETISQEERTAPVRRPQITPSTIVSMAIQHDLVWIQLNPRAQLNVKEIGYAELVRYDPNYVVRTYAR